VNQIIQTLSTNLEFSRSFQVAHATIFITQC